MNTLTRAAVQGVACGLAFGLTIPLHWVFWKAQPVQAGSEPLDILRVKRLDLVDDKGIIRGFLKSNSTGAYAILLGVDGESLTIDSNGIHFVDRTDVVAEYDTEGVAIRNRLKLSVGTDGPALELFDKAGNVRASLGVASLESQKSGDVVSTPESSLVLFKRDGTVIWRAP